MTEAEEDIIPQDKQKELDLILDAALDELDDDGDDDDDLEDVVKNADSSTKDQSKGNNKAPIFGPLPPPNLKPKPSHTKDGHSLSSEEEAIKDMMRHMEALFPPESTNTSQGNTKRNDGSENQNINNDDTMSKKPKTSSNNTFKESPIQQNEMMEETMSKLFEQLSQNANDENFNGIDSDFDALGEDIMKEMAKEWESTINGGGGENQEEVVGQVVDGMMKQLLSKEFMYEPMKDICNQFPQWLTENKFKLDEKEYERYGKQYQYFQRIVHVYEYDPDNVARLTELMHDIQEYGQPPPELIKKLAPELEFDENGIPKMDGTGLGPMMNEDCCIM